MDFLCPQHPESVLQRPGMESARPCKGQLFPEADPVLFLVPNRKVTLRSHRSSPLYCSFNSFILQGNIRPAQGLSLSVVRGWEARADPEGLDTCSREGFTGTRSNASKLVHARANQPASPFPSQGQHRILSCGLAAPIM